MSAPKGVWKSVFYSAVIGWIVLLAITFRGPEGHRCEGRRVCVPALQIFRERAVLGGAKAVILISTVGQLFCGMACRDERVADDVRHSRATAQFRDTACGADWAGNKTPTWAVAVRLPVRGDRHVPGVLPERRRQAGGVPGCHFDLGDRPHISPIRSRSSCDGGWGNGSKPGPWTLRQQVQVGEPDRFVWVAICVVIFCLPFVARRGVLQGTAFSWFVRQHAPLVTIGVMLGVTVWYLVSARHTFKGPIRTIDLGGAPTIAPRRGTRKPPDHLT